MIKKILVPLDGSKLAEYVLPFVQEIATKLDAEIAMVSVTNRTQGYWPFEDLSRPNEIRLAAQATCSMEEQASKYLNSAAEKLENNGIKVTKEVICGKTAQEIIFYANDNHCDLIVVSAYGRGGFGKLTHGSTTARILKSASVPVTVIRPPR
jgi:nucleotide-binding universal stress UspA family protein